MEVKLDVNYTRMLRAILNKSWSKHPSKQQLYGHLPPITKTIQVRRTRHAGACSRSRDEIISDILLCTPSHGRAKPGRPARTYIQQFCVDTGYCLEDLPGAMDDGDEWREMGQRDPCWQRGMINDDILDSIPNTFLRWPGVSSPGQKFCSILSERRPMFILFVIYWTI